MTDRVAGERGTQIMLACMRITQILVRIIAAIPAVRPILDKMRVIGHVGSIEPGQQFDTLLIRMVRITIQILVA